MAIDDNTSYELTGAQVKDLAQRIKSSGSGMIVYVDASFESPSSITNVFSDSGLTTVADWEDMADVILAGGTVIAVYDNGSNKHQYVELVSVTVNDNIPFGKRFAGVISSNVGEGSNPLTIFLYYDDGIATPRWFAEGSSLPKRFSDLSGAVRTSQIADGAVTGAKIDLSSDAGTAVIKTITDSTGRTGIYFADGTLITTRKVQWTGNINTAWGTLYEGHTSDYYKFAPTDGADFYAEPNVQVTLLNNGTSGSCWLGAWEKSAQIVSGGWAIPAGALCFLRASTMNNAVLNLYIQAIGRWKA